MLFWFTEASKLCRVLRRVLKLSPGTLVRFCRPLSRVRNIDHLACETSPSGRAYRHECREWNLIDSLRMPHSHYYPGTFFLMAFRLRTNTYVTGPGCWRVFLTSQGSSNIRVTASCAQLAVKRSKIVNYMVKFISLYVSYSST